ncbi:MAG: hypothetical protein EOP60_02405 [Sphingomonadales bacterium]|nr:MAG: hypothetical protein EOP60_02405 [Sphingomonadales bacterium]
MLVREAIENFFASPPSDAGQIANERALQLELACHFRSLGWPVRFEVGLLAPRLSGSTLKPKLNLDLLVEVEGKRVGIELKVPLNGQHPETIYSFCADIEFLESIKRSNQVDLGFCLMATSDRVFWTDSGRGSAIHNQFRAIDGLLSGIIPKPTGLRDSCVALAGSYAAAHVWKPISGNNLFQDGRFLLLEVD